MYFHLFIATCLIGICVINTSLKAQCDTLPLANRWESTYFDSTYIDFTAAIQFGAPPIVVPHDSAGGRSGGEHLSVLSYANGTPKYIFNGHQLHRGGDYALLANGVAVGADSAGLYRELGKSVYQHLMMPLPGDTNKIYVFHCWASRTPTNVADSAWKNNLPALLSIYDARLDSFILRDSILHTRATESWTAIRHPDGMSWWLATRVHSPSGIRVYKLRSEGLEPDVLSLGGSEFGWREVEEAAGIAFSPSGLHLGWALRTSSRYDTIAGEHWIMDFDCATGLASNPVQVDDNLLYPGGASVCFSPQGAYMYGVKDDTTTGFRYENDVHRYRVDLSGGNNHGIAEHIFNTERNNGVALGPDNRIYGGPNAALKYIDHPDRWQALENPTSIAFPGGAISTTLPPDPWVAQGLNPQQRPIDLPLLRMPRIGGDNFVACGDTSEYLILENCYQELSQVSFEVGPGISVLQDNKPLLTLSFDTAETLDPVRYIALVNEHPCRTYRDTFWVYVDGCQLICEPVFSQSQTKECDSALVHNQWVFASGSYTEMFQSFQGCDSTSTVDLLINTSENTSSSLTACDSSLVHGSWRDASGTYPQTFTNFDGCDSTSVVELTINESVQTVSLINACDSVQIEDVWITEDGDYPTIYATSAGCDSTHVVSVSLQTTPLQLQLPTDTTIATLALLEINADSLAQFAFQWTPPSAVDCEDCSWLEVVAGFAGRLQVDIGEEPCISSQEINITREDLLVEVFSAPTAFSPNGDGNNDFFEIAVPTGAELLSFEIYNRWGTQVYASSCPCSPNRFGLIQTWDGNERGTPVNPGGFAYIGQIRYADGREELVEGSLLVVR